MKKILFGQLFKLLMLVSSVSILAACGASDVNSGGEVLGTISVSGADTSVIGSSFSPTADAATDSTDNFGIVGVALGEGTVDFLAQSGVVRALAVVFNLDETLLSIEYVVGFSDNDVEYKYAVNCIDNDGCPGLSVDIATSTITLSNVQLFVAQEVGNPATDSITLNGSTRYRAQ